ncbi:MAG: metalloregulator ArsR/SmtB family transcription factor [Hyphomonadaceae bacterium]
MKNDNAVLALSALAQEHRLGVFRMLVKAGPEGMAAGAIADALGLPASSLSFHLAHLTRAGLVAQRRESRSLIYSADFDRMNGLLAYLVEDCCQGRPEVCTPMAEAVSRASCCTPATAKRKRERA